MTLDNRAAFRRGFILKCAEAGLTLEQTNKLAEELVTALRSKQAEGLVNDTVGIAKDIGGALASPLKGSWEFIKKVSPYAAMAAIAAPPAVGYGVGKLLAQSTDYDDTDVDAIKQHELIDEYLRGAETLRASQGKPKKLRKV